MAKRPRRAAEELRKFASFNLIGLFNTGITYLLYSALVCLGAPYAAALVAEYAVGIVITFFANKRFTFRDSGPFRWAAFSRMVAAVAVGFAVNLGLLELFVSRFRLDEYAGQFFALGLTSIVSFALQRFFVFAPGKDGST